jgi:hypothetical protein
MFTLQQPFAPAAAAAALWGLPPSAPKVQGADAIAQDEASAFAVEMNPLAASRPRQPGLQKPSLGGLNEDPDAACSVWLDPRKTRVAAPPMPDLPEPRQPKTQFAAQGPAVLEALLLDVSTRCVCQPLVCVERGGAFTPYSIGALLVTIRNGVRVRRMLQDAGIVASSAALRSIRADDFPCLCATLGGDPDLVTALVNFAAAYGDTSALMNPGPPAQTVAYLNTVFVNNTLDNIQTTVNGAARANYARAEGNRAYVTPRPAPPDSLVESPLVAAAETSAALVTRALTDPASNPTRRAELACLTGLPL